MAENERRKRFAEDGLEFTKLEGKPDPAELERRRRVLAGELEDSEPKEDGQP